MKFTKNCTLVNYSAFKSKDGREFRKVTLIDYNQARDTAEAMTQFVDTMPQLLTDGKAKFGDVVACEFDIADLTSKPKLVDIKRVVKAYAMPTELGAEA